MLLRPDAGTFAYQGQTHHSGRAKFEPPDGKTILIIGQTTREIDDYAREAGTGAPGGYMIYTSMDDLSGLTGPFEGVGCEDAGEVDLGGLVRRYPRSVGQIGLSMGGELDAVNGGAFDENIRKLAEIIRRTNNPIFLRIGYEFDGPWNRYNPASYVKAFQRIVSILRGASINGRAIEPVNNVAFVWHSAAWSTFEGRPFEDWYPGDEYVDWVAVSWFAWPTSEAMNAGEASRAAVSSFAQRHGKPMMIAESAPKKYFAPANPQSWDGWYAPVFNWIAANNVKAFSYINQDWNAQRMWRDPACNTGGDWGNSRVQDGSPVVLHRWQAAVADPRFLRASNDLFEMIGFKPQP
jgi:Glycosyl hydrolase family 26